MNQEEMIKDLQKEVENLKSHYEKEIQNLKDLHEVQELMSRYFYLHGANMIDEKIELFAHKAPDVRIEIADMGVFEGFETIKKYYKEGEGSQDFTGKMFLHTLTTPSIQVAGDGKTAKGIWFSPGHETMGFGQEKPKAFWSWGTMAADFIKEDGVWKIWHYHVYGMFKCPYEKSWVEDIQKPSPEMLAEMAKNPDRGPTTYHHEYSIDTKRELVPAPPDPYETFDHSGAY